MTSKRLNVSLATIAIATAFGGATSAFAQDEDGAALEEIIVTAQRRSESLQDVPIAITAFTQEDLERTAAVGRALVSSSSIRSTTVTSSGEAPRASCCSGVRFFIMICEAISNGVLPINGGLPLSK